MAYEYSIVIEGATIGAEAMLHEQQGAFLNKLATINAHILSTMITSLASLRGGGWEIISHSESLIGGRVVLSLLIRRPGKNN